MGILDKRAAELSADDLKSIEKPLGKRLPFPMLGLGRASSAGKGNYVTRYLGTLERPLTICSERSLDEVEGILLRDMPTPEMLPLFYETMNAMHPRNPRRAMFIVGAPGAGKTFLGDLAGRVASKKGAIKIDCTGLNLNELFYETVLDFKGGKRFYDALDDKLAKYNEHVQDKAIRDSILNPMSVDILRDSLGEAFTEGADGTIGIDWGGIKKAHKNDQGEYLTSRQSSEIAMAGLLKVSRKEGLDATGGNALGMATQEGVAWQAYKEGRVLILDELNRAKSGTFGVLHGWLQFVIGETSEYIARNPLKEKGDKTAQNLRFTRDGMTAGHFVFMTGNTLEDSSEVLELPEALSSRIVPKHVPKATQAGWQHRFCQALTGFPISTYYQANSDVWAKNPESFERDLMKYRRQGEDRVIPQDHIRDLRRWKNVLKATENLSKFLDAAGQIVNPDSQWYKKANSLAALMEEISESYKKEVSVDFRKITYFLTMAGQDKPTVRQPDGGPQVTPFIGAEDMPETPEDIREKLGTYLTYVVVDWIVSNTFDRGKDGLGRQLLQLAEDCAIIPPTLKDARPSGRATLAELLDNNPYRSEDPDIQAGIVRSLLCRKLRNTYPDIRASDDELMSVTMVRNAMQDMKGASPAGQSQPEENNIAILNADQATVYTSPLARAAVIDSASGQRPGKETLVTRDDFLYALATPGLRQKNIESLWTRGLSKAHIFADAANDTGIDPAIAVAEARNESSVGITTAMVAGKNGAEPLHILWNRVSDRLVIIGDAPVAPDLEKIFRKSSITFINRNDADATAHVTRALQSVMNAGEGNIGETYLRRAFLLRTMLTAEGEEKNSLAELLVRKDTTPYLPIYIAKTAKPSLAA